MQDHAHIGPWLFHILSLLLLHKSELDTRIYFSESIAVVHTKQFILEKGGSREETGEILSINVDLMEWGKNRTT